MKLDKTLKQFIATVLTIIMVVTIIPFAPVALGIVDEEESENYAYADPSVPEGCLNFTATGGAVTIQLKKNGTPKDISLVYTTDGGANWEPFSIDTEYPITQDETMYIRAADENKTFSTRMSECYNFVFGGAGKVNANGSVMYLLTSDGALDTVQEFCFYALFQECSNLLTAPELPATTLAKACYFGMFENCVNLTKAPELPAEGLANACYGQMFTSCSSLTMAPGLPAQELAASCYYGMFMNCSSLTKAPELPAATLTDECYLGMFAGCTKLNHVKVGFTEWPEVSESSPLYMWLLGVPTGGVLYCSEEYYDNLVNVTNGDSTIPENWTVQNPQVKVVIKGEADQYMILSELNDYLAGDAAEKDVEIILQTDVAIGNNSLFLKGTGNRTFDLACHSITSNRASQAAPYGTVYVSYECNGQVVITGTGIIKNTTPDEVALFAEGPFELGGNVTLVADRALSVRTCTATISGVTMNGNVECNHVGLIIEGGAFASPIIAGYNATVTINGGVFDSAMQVSDETSTITIKGGKFKEHPIDTKTGNGTIVLQEGYAVVAINNGEPYYSEGYRYKVVEGQAPEQPSGDGVPEDCFNLTAVGGSVTIKLSVHPGQTNKNLVYTTDGGTNWNSISVNESYSVTEDETMYIRAQDKNDKFADNGGYFQFVFNGDGQVRADGSIMFLLTSSGALDVVPENAFWNLFNGCTSLISAPTLPAKTVNTYSYHSMFKGCTSLTSAPELPATTLGSNCYGNMFEMCTSLVSAPELPATTLGTSCYANMFKGCTSMIKGPSSLPAIQAKDNCYSQMFASCSSLKCSPDICLSEISGVFSSLDAMFKNASSLCKVTVHFTSWPGTANWLSGVAEEGTFICPDELTISRGANRVPEGWLVGEGMVGYYAEVANGTITLKYEGTTEPSIKSITYLNGNPLTGNDRVTQEGLKIEYKVPVVDSENDVAGCIYKITYTVDGASHVMYVNTRVRYAPIVHDTSSLANAKAKAEEVLSDGFAQVGDTSDLAFITSNSATTATVNLLTTQNNKTKLQTIINQSGAVDALRSQDELDSAATAIDSGRVDYLKNCSTQFLYLDNNAVKTTNVDNVKISSVSYYPEPKVMGGHYSFFEKECQGNMQTIKNPAANGTIVELSTSGAYTFYVNAIINGVAKETFAYVSVGDNAPSKEEIVASIAAFTNAKYAQTNEGTVTLIPDSAEGAIIVNGTNIEYVIASYSGNKEFDSYNDFILTGYTGLSNITKNDLVDSVEFAGALGVARDGNYSFFVSFENGQSVCTSVAISGVPEPVEFDVNGGNISWTAKRGAVVENMSYVLGDKMTTASEEGFLPIQSGANQVAALKGNEVHTFKIRLLANGTRYTYYRTVTSGECNTPAVVVMSSAIGVYPRVDNVGNIKSIAYAKGNILTWDDMTKAADVTYVPIEAGGITLDKTEFSSGQYTFMFKTNDSVVTQKITVK